MDLTWLRALLGPLLHRIWKNVHRLGPVRSANQPSDQQQDMGTCKRSDGAICFDTFANQLAGSGHSTRARQGLEGIFTFPSQLSKVKLTGIESNVSTFSFRTLTESFPYVSDKPRAPATYSFT